MRRIFLSTSLTTCLALALGCGPNLKSSAGFALPDGDPAAGEQTFIELQCHSCHTVRGEGLELPAPIAPGDVTVALGGETTRVKTYGNLVTSIINPSHKLAPGVRRNDAFRDGESLMTVYNETMTVQQLIDLVAFLQSHYKIVPPEYEYYMP